jgi:hypothetical protein
MTMRALLLVALLAIHHTHAQPDLGGPGPSPSPSPPPSVVRPVVCGEFLLSTAYIAYMDTDSDVLTEVTFDGDPHIPYYCAPVGMLIPILVNQNNVHTIRIGVPTFTQLHPYAYSGLTTHQPNEHVTTMEFHAMPIESLHDSVFNGFKILQKVILRDLPYLATVPRGIFDHSNIHLIEFRNMHLDALPADLFTLSHYDGEMHVTFDAAGIWRLPKNLFAKKNSAGDNPWTITYNENPMQCGSHGEISNTACECTGGSDWHLVETVHDIQCVKTCGIILQQMGVTPVNNAITVPSTVSCLKAGAFNEFATNFQTLHLTTPLAHVPVDLFVQTSPNAISAITMDVRDWATFPIGFLAPLIHLQTVTVTSSAGTTPVSRVFTPFLANAVLRTLTIEGIYAQTLPLTFLFGLPLLQTLTLNVPSLGIIPATLLWGAPTLKTFVFVGGTAIDRLPIELFQRSPDLAVITLSGLRNLRRLPKALFLHTATAHTVHYTDIGITCAADGTISATGCTCMDGYVLVESATMVECIPYTEEPSEPPVALCPANCTCTADVGAVGPHGVHGHGGAMTDGIPGRTLALLLISCGGALALLAQGILVYTRRRRHLARAQRRINGI